MFKKKLFLFFIISLLLLSIFFYNNNTNDSIYKKDILSVHFINVGQGDATLIMINNKTLLIDSGPRESKRTIVKYLKSLNIKNIDYVILTHPHEDHMGNMDTIISSFHPNFFYAPKVITASKSFDLTIDSLVKNNLPIHVVNNSLKDISLHNDIKIKLLSSNYNSEYENLNLYSPIIKLTYKNISFIFTGDAETENEIDVLSNNKNIKADVLKIGHHGSSTSTSTSFFEAISPRIAIISVGENNSYDHPSKETLSLLKATNTPFFRTDLNNTIVITSNGSYIHAKFPYK